MKKPYIVLLICFFAAAAMCLTVSWPRSSQAQPDVTQPTTQPSTETQPTTTQQQQPEAFCLYICDREDSRAFTQFAQRFTEETGILCQIVTGELMELLSSDTPPTVFCAHTRLQLVQWQEWMLPLTDEELLSRLCCSEFTWQVDGQPVALVMDMEAYGLIYNAQLLAKAGFSREDIPDFAALQAYASHITANYKDMGFYPLCAPDLDDANLLEQLLSLSENPAQIRAFLDLYIENSTAAGPALIQFPEGEFVFYLGSASDYYRFSQLGINNLDILPAYTPEGGSFHFSGSTYWAVNVHADAVEQQAALAFLRWMVTAGEDGTTAPVTELGWFAPFRDISGGNALENKLRGYLKDEVVTVQPRNPKSWTGALLNELVISLKSYMADPSDENWAAVLAAIPA